MGGRQGGDWEVGGGRGTGGKGQRGVGQRDLRHQGHPQPMQADFVLLILQKLRTMRGCVNGREDLLGGGGLPDVRQAGVDDTLV